VLPKKLTKKRENHTWWVSDNGTLCLFGWTEKELIKEARRRNIRTAKNMLVNEFVSEANHCQGKICLDKDRLVRGAMGYTYSVCYLNRSTKQVYGLRRALVCLCEECLESMLNELRGNRHE